MGSVRVGRGIRPLLLAYAFVFLPILLTACGGGGTTTERTVVEETTVEETASAPQKEGNTPENGQASGEGEGSQEGGSGAPSPEPKPKPPPDPPPSQTVEVECGEGDENELTCTNTDGAPYSCSGGDSTGMGSEYRCEDPVDQPYECEVVSSRVGGFTLSCTKLLQ